VEQSHSKHTLCMANIWNAPTPPKRPDVSAFVDVSALLSLLSSTLVWFSNQTMNRASLSYSTLQPNKKWSGSVLNARHKMEWLHSQKLEWSRSIPIGSPTKCTLIV
jgi:hypothetical protein